MRIDPDHAGAMGVVIGQIAGGLGVWYSWQADRPTLALIAAIAAGAMFGAVCLGYAAYKAAQALGREVLLEKCDRRGG
jgi:ABC-type Mn2+/Zn2+ transport system permease subunit